jgi:hypothetical protein
MPNPRFGFVDWAEKINSRAAMLGFFGILAVEAIAGKGVLEMVSAWGETLRAVMLLCPMLPSAAPQPPYGHACGAHDDLAGGLPRWLRARV